MYSFSVYNPRFHGLTQSSGNRKFNFFYCANYKYNFDRVIQKKTDRHELVYSPPHVYPFKSCSELSTDLSHLVGLLFGSVTVLGQSD